MTIATSDHSFDGLADGGLARAAAYLATLPAVTTAYLLGSAAIGRLRPDSDIDIAILPTSPEGISVTERLRIAADLTDCLGRTTDLGVLSTSNLVYAKEAVANGSVLYERDHIVTARFEMLVLAMYAELQEVRREVLRAYTAA